MDTDLFYRRTTIVFGILSVCIGVYSWLIFPREFGLEKIAHDGDG